MPASNSPGMDPQSCLSQLSRLLADETRLLGILEEQLQHENELLRANDIDTLELASDARQKTVAGLLQVDDERRAICRLLGQSADPTGLAALLRWCDPAGSLAVELADCATRAQRCRERNDGNGALVSARLRHVTNMLGMLDPRASGTRVYGPSGGTAVPVRTDTGRMLNASA